MSEVSVEAERADGWGSTLAGRNFGPNRPRPWRDVWGAVREIVARLTREYEEARRALT